MIISLDYDKTYTADPGLWDKFIETAKARGHEVICITMRDGSDEERISMPVPVIYTSRLAKAKFMRDAGRQVDIWIDDTPWWILQNGDGS